MIAACRRGPVLRPSLIDHLARPLYQLLNRKRRSLLGTLSGIGVELRHNTIQGLYSRRLAVAQPLP